jgi:uncharacterized membrane protein
MNSHWFRQQWQPIPHPLRLLVVILLVLGIFFRFANLEKRVYWHDEALTSLRMSGYTTEEFKQETRNKFPISIRDLEKYKYPISDKTFVDTIRALATENSQHPPLYYLLTRWWVQIWGNSVAVIRSLSALFSLLLFPAIYWLCLELFDKPLVSWMAIALFAVSPFQLLLAQEARQYSLWAVMITLSSALLLYALRTNTRRSWIAYAISLSLSFYTFPLTLLVAVSHVLYVFVVNQARITRSMLHYLGAAIAGFAAFLPWVLVVVIRSQKVESTTDWLSRPMDLLSLIKLWFLNLSRLFIDFNSDFDYHLNNPITYLVPVIIGLAVYAIYFLYSRGPQSSAQFLLLLFGACSLVFVVTDLVSGGRRSAIARYLIPCYLSIQIAVAYLLACKIQASSSNTYVKKGWQLTFTGLTLCGILSCVGIINSENWWSKSYSNSNLEMSSLINQSSRPVLVSDDKVGNILSLSYRLSDKTQIYLIRQPKQQQLQPIDGEVFLLNPSKDLREVIATQTGRKAKKIYQNPKFNMELWKLT